MCLDFYGFPGQHKRLIPKNGLPDRERLRLQRFLSGIRVTTSHVDPSGKGAGTPRVIRKLSEKGAQDVRFALRDGGQKTVAAYFTETYNTPLKYPDMLCVEVRLFVHHLRIFTALALASKLTFIVYVGWFRSSDPP